MADLSQYGTVSSGPPPDMSAYGVISGKPDQPSIVSDALKYSPVGMVKSLADMIRTAASGQNPFKGMADANAKILDKAKSSFANGDYAQAAVHFANYLNPLGGAFEDISQDLQDGNIGHAAAKFAGLTSSLMAGSKGPVVLDAATRPALGADIAAATKGAARGAFDAAVKPIQYGRLRLPVPQPLAGAATGGYAARMLGLPTEAGAVVGGAYPIVRGAIGGAREALAERAANAADALSSSGEVPLAPPAPAGLLGRGAIIPPSPADTSGPIAPTLPENYQPPANSASGIPASMPETPTLDALAKAGIFGKTYKSFAEAPESVQKVIRALARSESAGATTPTVPAPAAALNSQGQPAAQLPPAPRIITPPPPPDASSVRSVPLAEIDPQMATHAGAPQPPAIIPSAGPLRPPLVVPRETITPASVDRASAPAGSPAKSAGPIRPPLSQAILEASPLRSTMTKLPQVARKAVADATYAGDQDPELAAQVYSAAHGANKADVMAAELFRQKVPSTFLASVPDLTNNPVIEQVRKSLGIKSKMSQDSMSQMFQSLRKLENTVPTE